MELRPSAWQATPEHNQVLLKLKKRKEMARGSILGPGQQLQREKVGMRWEIRQGWVS